jgi:hypothetical protein
MQVDLFGKLEDIQKLSKEDIQKHLALAASMCVNNTGNQFIFYQNDIQKLAFDFIARLTDKSADEGMETDDNNKGIRIALQCLSNSITNNQPIQECSWFLFEKYQNLIILLLDSSESRIVCTTLILIRNWTCNNHALLCNLTTSNSCLAIAIANLFCISVSSADLVFELSKSILDILFERDFLPHLYDAVFKSSRVALLELVSNLVESRILLNTLKFLVATLSKLISDQELCNVSQTEIWLIANILFTVTEPPLLQQYLYTLLNSGIVNVLIESLDNLRKIHPVVNQLKHQVDNLASSPLFGIKALLVQVIGNLSFENSDVQDQIRENSGIEVILSHCSLDDLNPFIREKALFAIRNITDKNEQNHKMIASLEAKKFIPHAILEEIGVDLNKLSDQIMQKA